jgi:hypothetical protein
MPDTPQKRQASKIFSHRSCRMDPAQTAFSASLSRSPSATYPMYFTKNRFIMSLPLLLYRRGNIPFQAKNSGR